MATPNYQYDKRQRELAKKQKKEQKLQRRQERKTLPADVTSPPQETVEDKPAQPREGD